MAVSGAARGESTAVRCDGRARQRRECGGAAAARVGASVVARRVGLVSGSALGWVLYVRPYGTRGAEHAANCSTFVLKKKT